MMTEFTKLLFLKCESRCLFRNAGVIASCECATLSAQNGREVHVAAMTTARKTTVISLKPDVSVLFKVAYPGKGKQSVASLPSVAWQPVFASDGRKLPMLVVALGRHVSLCALREGEDGSFTCAVVKEFETERLISAVQWLGPSALLVLAVDGVVSLVDAELGLCLEYVDARFSVQPDGVFVF